MHSLEEVARSLERGEQVCTSLDDVCLLPARPCGASLQDVVKRFKACISSGQDQDLEQSGSRA